MRVIEQAGWGSWRWCRVAEEFIAVGGRVCIIHLSKILNITKLSCVTEFPSQEFDVKKLHDLQFLFLLVSIIFSHILERRIWTHHFLNVY